eukprot:1179536-Prorocentrum_minimum.AAC.2
MVYCVGIAHVTVRRTSRFLQVCYMRAGLLLSISFRSTLIFFHIDACWDVFVACAPSGAPIGRFRIKP